MAASRCSAALLTGAAVLASVLAAAAPSGAAVAPTGKPDLAVTHLHAKPLAATPGCPASSCLAVRVRAIVRNHGRRPAGLTRLGLYASRDRTFGPTDLELGQLRIDTMRPTRGRVRTSTLKLPDATLTRLRAAGLTWRMLACADAAGRLLEAREGDNCRSVAFTLFALPAGFTALPGGPTIADQAPAPPPTAPPPPIVPCTGADYHADLCRALAERSAAHLVADYADAVAFALLYQRLKTGQPIPKSVAGGAIDSVRREADPFSGAGSVAADRVRGFLDFWLNPPGATDLDAGLAAYGAAQDAARQGPTNAETAAMVADGATWQDTLSRWTGEDQGAYGGPRAYFDLLSEAQRTMEDVDAVAHPGATPAAESAAGA